jgi:hypothetical protein
VLLLLLPPVVQAQFTYTNNNGTMTITKYTEAGGSVVIPSETNGIPVVSIGDRVFFDCTNVTVITIPSSITTLGLNVLRVSTHNLQTTSWC